VFGSVASGEADEQSDVDLSSRCPSRDFGRGFELACFERP
jgi:predicted nucleotidyltransferase